MPPRRAHIRGETRSLATKLANPEAPQPDVVLLASTIDPQLLRALEIRRRQYLRGKRGKKPKPLAEFVMWGPPRHAAEDAWTREKSKEWAVESVAWVRRHFPDSPITEAALHMDEGSPHVHVALFPAYKDKAGETAYGWKRAERAATDRLRGAEPLLNAGRQHVRGRKRAGNAMQALLDDYHKTVGKPFGLTRGERGSGREHKAITADEATRRHAADRAAKLDVRERKLEAERADVATQRQAVKVEREDVAAQRQAAKADFDQKADMLLEAQDSLNEREARIDADAKRRDADFNQRELTLRRIERDQAEAKAAAKAEIAGELRRLTQLEEYLREVEPLAEEALKNRKAKEAQERADREYEDRRRRFHEEDAKRVAGEEEEKRERAEADEAERRKKAKAKVVPRRSWLGLRGEDRGLGR